MAENKTQATAASVEAFLDTVPDEQRRTDARTVAALMAKVSGQPAAMWGPAIVGFGKYRYKYDSGRVGEMCRIGFSPRKAALTLYLASGYPMREALLARLGKHSTGKGCLYLKSLADVDMAVLEELIAGSLADNRARYPE
jgi:hypothetical protein